MNRYFWVWLKFIFNYENNFILSLSASGLQLFIAKDGTTAFGSHDVKRQASSGAFQQVVMDKS